MSDKGVVAVGVLPALERAVRLVERWRANADRGRLAELRRLGKGVMPGESFFVIADAMQATRHEEEFLLRFLPLAAMARHRPGLRPGVAFKAAEISSTRFERWLRSPAHVAVEQSRALIRRCEALDVVRLGRLLYRWSDSDRLTLAREFYRQAPTKTGAPVPTIMTSE
ncbi:MAG: hypothetical protein NW201_08255 [Gemmatimonadales bacterium]|nr:hypothetical protein [Gemmatimonadales bacterium]